MSYYMKNETQNYTVRRGLTKYRTDRESANPNPNPSFNHNFRKIFFSARIVNKIYGTVYQIM